MTTVAGSVSVNAADATHTGTGLAYDRFLAKVEAETAYWASRGLDVAVADKARLFGIWAAELTGDTDPLAEAIDAGGGGGGGGTVSTDSTLTGDGSGGSPLGVDTSTIATKAFVNAADATLSSSISGKVSSVGGTAPIVSSGGSTPAISITAASGAAAGSMSAADFTKLAGISAGATVFTTEDAQDAVGALVADSTTIDATYNDAGNVETLEVIDGSITSAKLDATALAQMHAIANGLFL